MLVLFRGGVQGGGVRCREVGSLGKVAGITSYFLLVFFSLLYTGAILSIGGVVA